MKKWGVFIIIIVLMTGGCANVRETYTADGQDGYRIDCSGGLANWTVCYDKAKEICGVLGYEILEKNDARIMNKKDPTYKMIPESEMQRSMIIKCKR